MQLQSVWQISADPCSPPSVLRHSLLLALHSSLVFVTTGRRKRGDGRGRKLHLDGKGRRAVSERRGCPNRGTERPVARQKHHHHHHHLLYVTGEASLMQSHVKGPPTTTTTTSTPTEQLPSVSWEKILVIEDFFQQEKSAGAASVLHVSFTLPLCDGVQTLTHF